MFPPEPPGFSHGEAQDDAVIGQGRGVVASGPEATNNVAEYTAIIAALEWLDSQGLIGETIEVRSDSQLCIRQIQGVYAVRSPRISPLYRRAMDLSRRFRSLRFRWVPREQNREADTLSRLAYAEGVGTAAGTVAASLDAEHVGGAEWSVASASTPGLRYVVNLATMSCECPGHARGGRMCKHIRAALVAAGCE